MDEKITQEPLTKSNKTKYRLAKSMKKCMQSSSVESITVKQIAGMGFSNVGLGIAHSMAHTLGAVYDTPHGVACAMMLPIVMEYNQECTGEKYREIARAMGVKGVDDMTEKLLLMQLKNFLLMLESRQNWKLSKKKIFSFWQNPHMQMHVHLETRKMQALKT